MNVEEIISELKTLYPGKKIVVNTPENPTEIVCEVESAFIHPEKSINVVVIDESVEHYHRNTQEEYEVMRGNLIVVKDGARHALKEGESIVILPNEHHRAEGHGTWIKVTSTPGWVDNDHYLVEGGEESSSR